MPDSYKEHEYSSTGKVTRWTSSSGANYVDYEEIGRAIERGRAAERAKMESGSDFSFDGFSRPSILMEILTPLYIVGGAIFSLVFIAWLIWLIFF